MKKIDLKYEGRGERLDKYLANLFSSFSRSQIQKSIINGTITVNGVAVEPNYRLKANDHIIGTLAGVKPIELIPQKIDLDIIFENDEVLVINKPVGIVVHPGVANTTGTIANALLYHYPDIIKAVPDRGGDQIKALRYGIVHRLDKDTSGVMIVAKNKKSFDFLKSQFDKRDVKKTYLALCCGAPKSNKGELIDFLGRASSDRKMMVEVGESNGKKAISGYKILSQYKLDATILSLIEFSIKTGRTHQIRAQSKLAGFPVLGDSIYFTKESRAASDKLRAHRQLLHSHTLSLIISDKSKIRTFIAPIPDDMKVIISKLPVSSL